MVDDEICEFGSVTSANFTGLPDIATAVQHSVKVTTIRTHVCVHVHIHVYMYR